MQDYFVHPVLRPLGRTACVQNRSRRFCRLASQVLVPNIVLFCTEILEKVKKVVGDARFELATELDGTQTNV